MPRVSPARALLWAAVVLSVFLLGCSSEFVISEPAANAPVDGSANRQSGVDPASTTETVADERPAQGVHSSTVVREPTFVEGRVASDVSDVFAAAARRFEDPDAALTNLFLVEDRLVESDSFDAWAFDGWGFAGETQVLIVPSEDLDHPFAIGLILEQHPESKVARQAVLASLAVTDEQTVNDAVVDHFENQVPESTAFVGSTHTIEFTELTTASDGSSTWFATFVRNDAGFAHDDVRSALNSILAGLTGPVAATEATLSQVEFNDHFIASNSKLRFGMSFEEFQEITGLEATLRVSFKITATESFGDLGDAVYEFDPEFGLYGVVHQFRLPEAQVTELALATFGSLDPDMPDLYAIYGSRDAPPASWTGQWTHPLPDHDDVWVFTFKSSLIVRSTMPGAPGL